MVDRAKPSIFTGREIWMRIGNRLQYFAMARLGLFTEE